MLKQVQHDIGIHCHPCGSLPDWIEQRAVRRAGVQIEALFWIPTFVGMTLYFLARVDPIH
jgi:hypothetical protein